MANKISNKANTIYINKIKLLGVAIYTFYLCIKYLYSEFAHFQKIVFYIHNCALGCN